jgi:hypothetical protein
VQGLVGQERKGRVSYALFLLVRFPNERFGECTGTGPRRGQGSRTTGSAGSVSRTGFVPPHGIVYSLSRVIRGGERRFRVHIQSGGGLYTGLYTGIFRRRLGR